MMREVLGLRSIVGKSSVSESETLINPNLPSSPFAFIRPSRGA